MKARVIEGAAALSLLGGQALSNNIHQQALVKLETNALAFSRAPKFQPVAPESLTGEHYYSKKNFPGAQESVSLRLPDAEVDPLTKSILVVDANETPLPHVRYHVEYSMDVPVDVPELQQAYVQITRYNVGPTRLDAVRATVPDGVAVGATEFGVGPHVAWRFVFAPVMGMRADILHASRAEVPHAQAQAADCLGASCLSLEDPTGPAQGWQAFTAPVSETPTYASVTEYGVATAAFTMQELWENITADGMDPLQYLPEQPHFEAVVSVNVAGQEAGTSGLVKQAVVMDDTVAEIWTRRLDIAEIPAELSRLQVKR